MDLIKTELIEDENSGFITIPPKLVLAFHCSNIFQNQKTFDLENITSVHINRADDSDVLVENKDKKINIYLPDKWTSKKHAIIEYVNDEWILQDLGASNKTFLNDSPILKNVLSDGDVIGIGGSIWVFRESYITHANNYHKKRKAENPILSSLNFKTQSIFNTLQLYACNERSMLIYGPPGCGKSLIARTLHTLSGREGDLMSVDCGALSQNLIEAELFGSEEGSFTDAKKSRKGLLYSADKGTLFLDEIGEMPLQLQTRLLHALEEKEIRPIGSNKYIKIQYKVICATTRFLDEDVKIGKFNEALYSRISGSIFHIPPLKERVEDIGALLAKFYNSGEKSFDRLSFSPILARNLFLYTWPSNIRGLVDFVENSISHINPNNEIGIDALPDKIRSYKFVKASTDPFSKDNVDLLNNIKKRPTKSQFIRLLKDNKGNITAIARFLQTSPSQVARKLNELELDVNEYR